MTTNLRLTISTIGAIIGLAGLEHGVGEVLQGNVKPQGFYIKSWPNSRLYDIVDGEPAITIMPSILLAGLITLMISILFIIWVMYYLESPYKRYNFIILIGFSLTLLISGGGVAPPVIGLLVSPFIGKIPTQDIHKQRKIQINGKKTKTWLITYILCIVAYGSLWPGLIIFGLFMEVTDPLLVICLVLVSFSSLFVALYSSTLLETTTDNDLAL